MKAVLIVVSCYALTYLGCAWLGGNNQIESFLETVSQQENCMVMSPPTRTSPYDQARPLFATTREDAPHAPVKADRIRRYRRYR